MATGSETQPAETTEEELSSVSSHVVNFPIGKDLFLQFHFEGVKVAPIIANTDVNLDIARQVGIQPVSFGEVMDQLRSVAGECKTTTPDGEEHTVIDPKNVDLYHITLSDEIMGENIFSNGQTRPNIPGNIWRVLGVGKNEQGEMCVTLQHCSVMGDSDTTSIAPFRVSIYQKLFTSIKVWDKKLDRDHLSLEQTVDYNLTHAEYEEGRLSQESVVFRADEEGVLQRASY